MAGRVRLVLFSRAVDPHKNGRFPPRRRYAPIKPRNGLNKAGRSNRKALGYRSNTRHANCRTGCNCPDFGRVRTQNPRFGRSALHRETGEKRQQSQEEAAHHERQIRLERLIVHYAAQNRALAGP